MEIQPGRFKERIEFYKLDIEKENDIYKIKENLINKMYSETRIKKQNLQMEDDVLESYDTIHLYTYFRDKIMDENDCLLIKFKNKDWHVLERYDVDLQHKYTEMSAKTLETPIKIYNYSSTGPEPNSINKNLIYETNGEVRIPVDTSKTVGKLKTKDAIQEFRIEIRNINNKFIPKNGQIVKVDHPFLNNEYKIVKIAIDETFITITVAEM